MPIRYVKDTKAALFTDGPQYDLLWGDPCHDRGSVSGNRRPVWARGLRGAVEIGDVTSTDPKLLELYVIDVGQGDAILMKTPDGKWHLIDGGKANEEKMLKQGAANFIRWKFLEDLRRDKVELENVVLSHPDADHFGGLVNVFDGRLPAYGTRPERTFPVEIRNFYHNGVGRFKGSDPLGGRQEGDIPDPPFPGQRLWRSASFITETLGGKGDFQNPPHPFTDDFQKLANRVVTRPQNVRRLSRTDGFLPGYAPGQSDCVIHVLGPIVETTQQGFSGLRWLSSESQTRNGHSIVLRVDYGNFRCLLTGDLNDKSQRLLLSYVPASEFQVDVAKGCHHGADEVEIDFVRAMAARATIISSGDNENYSHPRPRILGASAFYGRQGVDGDDRSVPPLVYSTELARSVDLDFPEGLRIAVESNGGDSKENVDLDDAEIDPEGGDGYRQLGTTPLATDLVYGLVNVRSDGQRILLGTLEESGHDFDIRVIKAGMSPPA